MTHLQDTHGLDRHNPALTGLMDLLTQHGTDAMAQAFAATLNIAMRLEREQHLGAAEHERSADRTGYANGFSPKQLDTPAGRVTVAVPKTRPVPGRGESFEPFFPQALERGSRACRAVNATLAAMYVQGVSTRDVKAVMTELGLENITSAQVSRATAELDEELRAWRGRPLGTVERLILDARYEKVREGGVVRDVAVLTAVGILPNGSRSVLGISVALSEAEVHWRDFLDSLVARGMRGVELVNSDDHAGLAEARKAVLPAVPWQRCQFHLANNAIHHAPTAATCEKIGKQLGQVWNAPARAEADRRLADLIDEHEPKSPRLAKWLGKNVPEGLTVFAFPPAQRKKLRTSNGIERPIQQELKRRTRKIRVFPNAESLLRLCSALLVEIDDDWQASTRRYLPASEEVAR
nr:IS256 family transposase [Phycisphaera mikurensis]